MISPISLGFSTAVIKQAMGICFHDFFENSVLWRGLHELSLFKNANELKGFSLFMCKKQLDKFND